MKRWLTRLLLLTASLLLLAGCITQQTTTTVKGDLSGTNVVIVGLSREALEMMGGEGGEDPFADVGNETSGMPAEWNAKAEPWEDEKFKGVKISTEFKDLAMLKAQLDQLIGPQSSGDTENPTAGMFSNIKAEQQGENIIIAATVDSSGGEESDPTTAEYFKEAVLTWSITLPSVDSFTEEAIAKKDGNTVTYTFPFGSSTPYNIEVKGAKSGGALGAIGGGGMALPIAIGVGVLLLGGLAFMFMRRKKPAPVAQGGYGQQGGYDPNQYGGQQQGGYGQQGGYDPNQYGGQQQSGYGQQGGYDPNQYGGQQQGGYGQDPNQRNG